MAVVVTDLIEGSGLTDDVSGLSATRVFQVSEITGPVSGILAAARNAPKIPARGDAHPAIPTISADTFNVTPQDRTKALVSVTYRRLNGLDVVNGDPVITVGTTLTTLTTSRDVRGDQVILIHPVQEFDGSGNLTGVRTERQIASFSVQVPITTVTYQRKEDRDPTGKSQFYVGKAGDIGPGRREGPGGPPWLCTGIEGVSEDGNETWDVSYRFSYTSRGWWAELEPVDPTTGQPYEGAGLTRIPIFEKVEFLNALLLPQVGIPGA